MSATGPWTPEVKTGELPSQLSFPLGDTYWSATMELSPKLPLRIAPFATSLQEQAARSTSTDTTANCFIFESMAHFTSLNLNPDMVRDSAARPYSVVIKQSVPQGR